jgi:hypothetical protein
MAKYVEEVPELLARYMDEQGDKRQWVTVKDIRSRFHLGRERSSPLYGFLYRFEIGPFFRYSFFVVRSEREGGSTRSNGVVLRYLVRKRAHQENKAGENRNPVGLPVTVPTSPGKIHQAVYDT